MTFHWLPASTRRNQDARMNLATRMNVVALVLTATAVSLSSVRRRGQLSRDRICPAGTRRSSARVLKR
jgi:hypothetical protein